MMRGEERGGREEEEQQQDRSRSSSDGRRQRRRQRRRRSAGSMGTVFPDMRCNGSDRRLYISTITVTWMLVQPFVA